eukprot:6877617-Pyramimonas_sp.AAC.1
MTTAPGLAAPAQFDMAGGETPATVDGLAGKAEEEDEDMVAVVPEDLDGDDRVSITSWFDG